MRANIEKVLKFWFGELSNELPGDEHKKLWYHATPKDDAYIRAQFLSLYEQATQRHLDNWLGSAQGTMALIILLDQMPRHIFRGSDRAFIADHLALEYCLFGLEKGYDKQLYLVERCFFYHPLEHAEDFALQQRCVHLFQRMQQTYIDQDHQIFIRQSLDYAQQHLDIIARFSRFPHRNEVLGRESTLEEIEYLKTAERYGQ